MEGGFLSIGYFFDEGGFVVNYKQSTGILEFGCIERFGKAIGCWVEKDIYFLFWGALPAAVLSAHTAQALVTGRYPLLSLTRNSGS